MRGLAERAGFALCRALGRLLRGARYATVRTTTRGGVREVRKRRALHAPLLVALGGPLVRLLDTGVRVLPQRAWAAREARCYRRLRRPAVRVEPDGTLVLPYLAGETLAALLADPALDGAARAAAVERAVVALAALHRSGLTHGDAMAENVLVDRDAGVAHWFDFETEHDARRPRAWRRADDVRALLATCLLRVPASRRAETVRLVLDRYGDDEVTGLVAAAFAPVVRRALPFHLGQAPLHYHDFREIARLVRARLAAGADDDPPRAGERSVAFLRDRLPPDIPSQRGDS